jgi:hypothetical protein
MKLSSFSRVWSVAAVLVLGWSAVMAAKSSKETPPPAVGEVVTLKFHSVKGANVDLAAMKFIKVFFNEDVTLG